MEQGRTDKPAWGKPGVRKGGKRYFNECIYVLCKTMYGCEYTNKDWK